jgi:hypothetical protein
MGWLSGMVEWDGINEEEWDEVGGSASLCVDGYIWGS